MAFYVDFLLTEVYTNEAVRLEGWPNTAAHLAIEESDPAGVILYVMDGPYLPARTGAVQLLADGIYYIYGMMDILRTQSSVMS